MLTRVRPSLILISGLLCAATVVGLVPPAAAQTASTKPAKAAATKPSAPKVAATVPTQPAPASLPTTARAAQALFEALSAQDWPAATSSLDALKTAVVQLHADLPASNASFAARLKEIDGHLTDAQKAVSAKTRQPAMLAANRTMRLASVLTESFISKSPQSLAQLEYLARELILLSVDPPDLKTLKPIPLRLDGVFAKLKKDAGAKLTPADATALTSKIAAAKKATTPAEYNITGSALLGDLQNMERAFAP